MQQMSALEAKLKAELQKLQSKAARAEAEIGQHNSERERLHGEQAQMVCCPITVACE